MVESPVVDLELNGFGELRFAIPPTHYLYNSTTINNAVVDMYIDDKWSDAFLVKSIDLTLDRIKQVRCKGILSYFEDTVVRPFEFKGDIPKFLQIILDNHNNQVSNKKKIFIGNITVFDKNNYINRSSGLYTNSWNVLVTRLLNTHGGYFRLRKSNEKYYLDYLQTLGTINKQAIRFGENLRDLIQIDTNDDVVNCLIPLGAELDETEGINGVIPRLNIKSVNSNLDYIKDASSISRFGEKWGTITFDDVTLASNLITKGREALKQLSVPMVSIEAKAIDLTNAGYSTDRWSIGDYIHCVSPYHNLDTEVLLSKMVIDLDNPELDEYFLGRVNHGFKKIQADRTTDINISIENVNTSNSINITNVANQITGARGGYKRDLFDDKGQTIGTAFMDAPNIESAKNVLLINQNGIAGTDKGFNGPYNVAITSKGVINADYIMAGVLKGIKIIADEGNVGGWQLLKNGFYNEAIEGFNYIERDAEIIMRSLLGEITLTDEQKEVYDFDKTGDVNAADYLVINNIATGVEPNFIKTRLHIDPLLAREMIKLEVIDGVRKGVKTSIGAFGIKGQSANFVRIVTSSFKSPSVNTNSISSFDVTGSNPSSRNDLTVMGAGKLSLVGNNGITANQAITITSDERLKCNINDIDLTEIIDLIDIKSFSYLYDELDAHERVGIVAQQLVGTGYEDIVLSIDSDGVYGVNYDALFLANIQKTKELENKIKELEEIINGK